MALKSRNKINPLFQMSSLTDIIFLLLIFFMLTSTFVAPRAIKVVLPNASGQTLAKQSLTVSITKDNQYYVENRKVSEADLEQVISGQMNRLDRENASIVLRADKETKHEAVVNVLKLGPKLDIKVILATQPE